MKNWKTTTVGFVAAALSFWAEGMTIRSAVQAAGLAALGAVARDAKKQDPHVLTRVYR